MKRATRTVKNIFGQTITVFDGDYIGNIIISKGIYEKQLISYASKILSAMHNPIVFDIGANIGNHALSFSRKASQVFAFEPVPEVFYVLSKNAEQNNLQHIHCMNFALSNTNGKDEIFLFQENLGASSFDKHDEHVTPITVSKRIGDEIIKEQNISKVDFIKIDTEGHEAYVLLGLEKTIKKCQPYIIVEWHDPLTIKRFQEADILDRMFSDYSIFVLGTNFDSLYWKNKSFAKIKQRFTRMLSRKQMRLYQFDPTKAYKNILLVPNGKVSLLPK